VESRGCGEVRIDYMLYILNTTMHQIHGHPFVVRKYQVLTVTNSRWKRHKQRNAHNERFFKAQGGFVGIDAGMKGKK
jgi:ribosomal protein L36